MSPKSLRILIAVLAGIVCCAILLFVLARTFADKLEPEIRARVIRYLEKRFASKVELGDVRIQIPKVSTVGLLLRGGHGTVAHVEGNNLQLRHEGRQDVPPMFSVESFSFDLDLGMLREAHPHVPHVALSGMTITLPPKNLQQPPTAAPPEQKASAPDQAASFASEAVVDNVDISDARLLILPSRKEAPPLDFAIAQIHLTSAGEKQQMGYEALLTNPRPPGQIHSRGSFGPWNSKTPGDTPLQGDYTFSNADLGVFDGIGGRLHSTGHFVGSLSAVRAQGEATVPDFYLKSSGNRVPLSTTFDVVVDGMNGNTILQPVHARLLNTYFQTSGGVIKHEANEPRAIHLSLLMNKGHIEDLLLLAVKGKPVMSGLIHMNAKIALPPLRGSVKEKLFLSGTFGIDQGEFLRSEVQQKIDELSRRGQGRPKDSNIDNVFSSMGGDFQLQSQVLTLTRLGFTVPGAAVALHGDYRMLDDSLDFHGDLKLQAKVSQTVTGWKHWLAKPIDRFFEKQGAGTFLKIQVVGNASKPEFGRERGKP